MPAGPAVYVFSSLAALLWGTGAVLAKRGLSVGGSPLLVTVFGSLFGTVLFWAAVVAAGLPAALERLTPPAVGVFLATGLVGTTLGRLSYYTGIERVGATVGEAVTNANPVVATAVAVAAVGEAVRPAEALGMVVVVAGVVGLSATKGGDLRGWDRRDLAYPLGAAVAFGAGNALRRYGLVTTPARPLEASAVNATAALVGVVGFVAATRRRSVLRVPRRAAGYLLGAGLFIALGLLALMLALRTGRVVVVAPISGAVPVFTVLFGYLFLGDVERVTRGVVAAVACIVAGVALLTGA